MAMIRSINSTEMKDPTQKEIARVPPIPPPKPKSSIKSCVEVTTKNGDSNKITNVRQAIIKGSKNPTGLSLGESFENAPQHQITSSPLKPQVMEVPRIQINSSRSSVISNEERDANLDIIFSDWGSQTFAQKQASFQHRKDDGVLTESSKTAERNSTHEPTFSTKDFDLKFNQKTFTRETTDHRPLNKKPQIPNCPKEKKQEDYVQDTEYLLPRLEKQSNQILVLAENNPMELKNDIIRNCDVLEEQIPGFGHTGNLLKYWEKVEASPRKEMNNNLEADLSLRLEKELPFSVNFQNNKVRGQESICNKQINDSVSNELNHEQVLNDILQEFENFNKDILDLDVDVDQEEKSYIDVNQEEKSDKKEIQKHDADNVETEHLTPNNDFLSTNTTQNRNAVTSNNPQIQEEGVYYELDTDETLTESAKFTKPIQEFNSKNEPNKMVTLIGFRKLDKDEQDSEVSNSVRSSVSTFYAEGQNPSTDYIKHDRISQTENERNTKKNSTKQKCLVM